MPARLSKSLNCLLSLLLLTPNCAFGQAAKPAVQRQLPGKTAAGMLLPNGWTLTPEGQQIPVSDLPLNMELSKDGRYLLVTTNGNGDQTINVIDLQTNASVQNIKVKK